MTFEQYFANWLAQYLDTEIDTLLNPESVSIILSDRDSSRKFLTESSITIDSIFSKKSDAAEWSQNVANALSAFEREKWISRVFMGVESGQRSGVRGKWQYTIIANILHKTRTSWDG